MADNADLNLDAPSDLQDIPDSAMELIPPPEGTYPDKYIHPSSKLEVLFSEANIYQGVSPSRCPGPRQGTWIQHRGEVVQHADGEEAWPHRQDLAAL